VTTLLKDDIVVHPILFIIIQKKEVRSKTTTKERALKDVLRSFDCTAKKSYERHTSVFAVFTFLSSFLVKVGGASANIAKIIAFKTVMSGEWDSRGRKRREKKVVH
jgi:hypothetical protein